MPGVLYFVDNANEFKLFWETSILLSELGIFNLKRSYHFTKCSVTRELSSSDRIYLPIEDIRKLSITCETINQRVRNSFYQTLKSKVEDWSIYQDIRLCERAREYLSFDYVSTDFQIGERPRIEGDIIFGDSFELNDGAEVYDEVEEDSVAFASPVDYFNTDPITNIILQCTWLSVKTINLEHLATNQLTGIKNLVNLKLLYT
jgi:hypothetical protein